MSPGYRESLADLRATIQQRILDRYPQFTLNAIEPYTWRCCRDLWEQAWKPTAQSRAEVTPMMARWPTELASLRSLVPLLRADFDATCHDKGRGNERYRQHITAKALKTFWRTRYLGVAHFFVMGSDELRPTTLEAIGARVHAGVFLLKYDTGPEATVFTREHVREGYRYRRLLWLLAIGSAEELTGQAVTVCREYFDLEGHILRTLISQRLLTVGERPKRGRFPWNDQVRAITDEIHAAFVEG